MSVRDIPDVNILSSPKKALIYIGIAALFVGALYAYFIYDYLHPEHKNVQDGKETVVIFVCGPLYVAALIWGIDRAFHPKPVIQLKKNYITWGSFGTPQNMFPWSEIVKFEVKSGSERQILVLLKNPEKYFDDRAGIRRAQERLVEKYGTHVFISTELTQVTRDELLMILQNYLDVVHEKPGAKLMQRYDL